MSEPSIFTKIINREIPAHIIYEDDRVIAFLTIQPFATGHTLVVPKRHVDQIWDMDGDDYEYLWNVSKKIALHLRQVMNSSRIGVVIKGNEVPHVHIHLIPMSKGAIVNLDPYPEPPLANSDQLAEIAEKLKI
ncbi:HIT domain-containing protein [Candidatus Saccharibacteria bacterium]|nr:HIT domain-containing protein [Candidatus Saccharibacteria bacterium]